MLNNSKSVLFNNEEQTTNKNNQKTLSKIFTNNLLNNFKKFYSKQKQLRILLRNRKRRFWKSMESKI